MATRDEKMTKAEIATRINAAADRLSKVGLDGRREKKLADRYVRNSIALDPDTPLAGKRRLH